ncbi:MAG: DUF445 family protein [Lachnospirales bacterium]
MYYFLSPIFGALIGYFTNWLAIKMIFRPYKEVYIGKLKVPFTPGLIPKDRKKISHKVGKTVSKHLLTEDVLLDAINGKDFTNVIEELYNSILNSGLNRTDTILEYLNERIGYDETDKLCVYIENELNDLLDKANSPLIKENLVSSINNKFIEVLESEENKTKVKELVSNFIGRLSSKKEINFQKLLTNEKKINEVMSEESGNKLKAIISSNIPFIINIIKNLLENDTDLDNTLKRITEKIVEANIGKFGAMFVKPDSIYENMRNKFITYITEDQVDVLNKIEYFIDSLGEKQVNEVTSKFSSETIDLFLENILQNVNDKIVNKILDDTLLVEIEKLYPDIKIRSKNFIYKYVNLFMEKEFTGVKKKIIKEIMYYIKGIKVSNIYKNINAIGKNKIVITSEELLKKGIKKSGTKIIEGINVDELVERQIDNFPIEEIENLVLEVANKELKMITYFGGFLGFFIGLLPCIKLLFV